MNKIIVNTAVLVCTISAMLFALGCGKVINEKKEVAPAVLSAMKEAHGKLLSSVESCKNAAAQAEKNGSPNIASFYRAAELSNQILADRHNKLLCVLDPMYAAPAVTAVPKDADPVAMLNPFQGKYLSVPIPEKTTKEILAVISLTLQITADNEALAKNVIADEDLPREFYLCTICGYLTDMALNEEICPVCSSFQEKIKALENGRFPVEKVKDTPFDEILQ